MRFAARVEIFPRRCRRQPEVGLKTPIAPQWVPSTMVYGITVRRAGMKDLIVTKQQCTNCIGSPRETDAAVRYL